MCICLFIVSVYVCMRVIESKLMQIRMLCGCLLFTTYAYIYYSSQFLFLFLLSSTWCLFKKKKSNKSDSIWFNYRVSLCGFYIFIIIIITQFFFFFAFSKLQIICELYSPIFLIFLFLLIYSYVWIQNLRTLTTVLAKKYGCWQCG